MSRTRGEETVEKWRGFLVEMQVKRGGGGERVQTEKPDKVEAKTKSKQRTWEYPCLLPGALGKVDADGTGMGIK